MTDAPLVSDYMTVEVRTAAPGTRLTDIARTLERWNISAVPIVDGDGALAGVVSRTDLLRVGRATRADRPAARRGAVLIVPDLPATEVMTRDVHVIGRHAALTDAAGQLWRRREHRLFVVDEGRLVGVLSATDVAAAVRDSGDRTPLAEIMTAPIVTVETAAPLGGALALLEEAHVTGLIVVEDGWPVGTFTQTEALAARGYPADALVEDVFDQAVICVPASTRVCRAAAQIARLDVRRVVACRDREAVGVVSALDLARMLSAAPRR